MRRLRRGKLAQEAEMRAGPGEAGRGPPVEGPVCHAKGYGLSCEGHRVPDQLCRTAKDKVAMQRLTACVQKLQAWQVPSAHIPGESWPRNPTCWSRLQPHATLTCHSKSPVSDKGSACVKGSETNTWYQERGNLQEKLPAFPTQPAPAGPLDLA